MHVGIPQEQIQASDELYQPYSGKSIIELLNHRISLGKRRLEKSNIDLLERKKIISKHEEQLNGLKTRRKELSNTICDLKMNLNERNSMRNSKILSLQERISKTEKSYVILQLFFRLKEAYINHDLQTLQKFIYQNLEDSINLSVLSYFLNGTSELVNKQSRQMSIHIEKLNHELKRCSFRQNESLMFPKMIPNIHNSKLDIVGNSISNKRLTKETPKQKPTFGSSLNAISRPISILPENGSLKKLVRIVETIVRENLTLVLLSFNCRH